MVTEAPYETFDPFAAAVRGIGEPNPAHASLRERGPIVRADATAGGPVWIITDEALARAVLNDVRIARARLTALPVRLRG